MRRILLKQLGVKSLEELDAKILSEVRERKRAYQRAYYQRPEVKEKARAYHQRPEVREKARAYQRAYYQRPEVREKARAYQRAYHQRPEVRERRRAYHQSLKPPKPAPVEFDIGD